MLIKKNLVIELNDNSMKVVSLYKKRKKYYMEKEEFFDLGIYKLLENDEKIKYLVEILKQKFNINKQFKNIHFYTQNDKVIIRNLKSIKSKKEKEILGLIEYEINQYMPIDFENYIIKYKKVINENEEELIQSILLPIEIITICKKISDNLKINKKYLNINFDILDRLIKSNMIKDLGDKKSLVLENNVENIIVNKIYKKQVVESYIINKNNSMKIYLDDLNRNNEVFFYGLKDEVMKEANINELSTKDNMNIYPIKENNINNLAYISTLGMMI